MLHKNRTRIEAGSFASVIRDYLASSKFASRAPNTQRSYKRYLFVAERPEILGALDVNDIDSGHVQAFLDGLGHKPGAQGAALTAIRAVVKWAVPRRKLPPNVPITFGCEVLKSDGGHTPWTDEQVALAEKHCRPFIARLITLASNTGQRGSDLVRMKWTDIEEHEGRLGINVKQQKTGIELWVPFTDELITAIATWERPTAAQMLANPDSRFLLLKPDGKPMTREQVSSCWNHFERSRHPDLAGLCIHGLRAAAVVRLRRAGAPATHIADCVGMSEPMVKRYCRKSLQRENALAAVSFLSARRVQLRKEAV